MKWLLTIIALLSALVFMALEAIVLLYAINNNHFAYYYGLIGLGSLLCVCIAHYLNRKNPSCTQGVKILHVFTHGVVYLLIICGMLAGSQLLVE